MYDVRLNGQVLFQSADSVPSVGAFERIRATLMCSSKVLTLWCDGAPLEGVKVDERGNEWWMDHSTEEPHWIESGELPIRTTAGSMLDGYALEADEG